MRFVIVTGMSGSGKITALRFLEDAGYYCVDNLPLPLIIPFAQLSVDGRSSELSKIAVGIDVRSGALSFDHAEEMLGELEKIGIKPDIIYMDASDEVLVARYKETRRAHPIAGPDGKVIDGIHLEREKTAFLRKRADYIFDTSQLLTRELKAEIDRIFREGKDFKNIYITIRSFGFKYGLPSDSDLVFDVRFLKNPYYDINLRPLTGKDPEIREFVEACPESGVFLDKLEDMLTFLIPNYITEGKNQLVVSIGCTGGRHRSVALSEAICERLRSKTEYGIRIEHRDMDRDLARKSGAYRRE
ncbi:MAG: RNase adapter RapZ [Lachnospiraceae bacterium]|nr:RNase adapter RapZ [Lachnospiraceae bacterium]